MSLLDKASLIVTPNGYSENTIYSVIPSSGAGDLTFTRATDGWRTNSQGLVQRVAWNLLQYSEQLENAAWSKTNSSIISNQAIAPNGALTADRFIEDTTNVLHIVNQSTTATGGFYTASVYIKPNGRNWIYISMAAASNYAAYFDVQNGVVGTVESNIISASITNAGNGWYRCVLTANTNALSPRVNIYTTISNGVTSYTGDGISGVYIWGAQLVEGSSALEYFPTTDRQDVPRIDYSLGGCPALLMEPQRTNIALQSEQISTSPWTNNGGTTALDATIAPTGLNTADKFNEDASTGQHYIGQQITGLALTTYTMSVFAKKAERDIIYIRCFNSVFGVTYCDVNFNLTTGVATGASTKIEAYPNGWYRCSVTFTTGADPIIQVRLNMTVSGNYNGIVGYGMYIWGAQLESGAYATSYIPTTTASVTRNVDRAIRTGISSLIGQTEGTIFVDFILKNPIASPNRVISITETNWVSGGSIRLDIASGEMAVDFVDNSVSVGTLNYFASFSQNVRYRAAVVYKANACVLYLNGVQVATKNISPMPTCSEIYLNELGGGFNGPNEASLIYSAILFKSALSSSELELLTGDSFDSYAKMAAYFNYTLQ